MEPPDVVRRAFDLRASGTSTAQIAREIDVNRQTVGNWFRRGIEATITSHRVDHAGGPCPTGCPRRTGLAEREYAYLLGQYLGDGWISKPVRGVYRMVLACCAAYPGIVSECTAALLAVMPGSSVVRQSQGGVTRLSMYSKHWPYLFPQHGPGMKHARAIVLEPWQRSIALQREPGPFARGLVHSDGWRGMNPARGANGRRYVYTRYQFSNRSVDIRQLFVEACDALGVETKQMNRWNISVNKRSSVALLDEHVGPKY